MEKDQNDANYYQPYFSVFEQKVLYRE